jgi:hypothetical protein
MKWLFLVLVVVGSATASACPPGPCSKYRHMQPPQLPPMPVVNTYTRAVRAEPPAFSVARVTAFLTSSQWEPFVAGPTGIAPPRLRFVEPSKARRATALLERVVLVREIRQDADLAVVSIDGEDFALYRCLDSTHHYTSCLTRYVAAP